MPRRTFEISISNRQKQRVTSAAKLRDVARFVLRAEGVAAATIGIALVSDSEMRALHRQFMNLDTPTDVLTFPFSESVESLAGEIAISVETAGRVGPKHGNSTETEVALYLIHGILHLCGYDDLSVQAARRMRRRQQSLLEDCFRLDWL